MCYRGANINPFANSSPVSIIMDGIHGIYKNAHIIYEEERFLEYTTGGFHPVALGDTFKDGRYIVRHKLGHGGFSTVWLARDIQYVVFLIS
jgi:hypothetical protein